MSTGYLLRHIGGPDSAAETRVETRTEFPKVSYEKMVVYPPVTAPVLEKPDKKVLMAATVVSLSVLACSVSPFFWGNRGGFWSYLSVDNGFWCFFGNCRGRNQDKR